MNCCDFLKFFSWSNYKLFYITLQYSIISWLFLLFFTEIYELLLQVAIPPEAEFVPLKPMMEKPAKEYPFILDPFQKEALLCLENNQSVLVSAHTSAGKTVVAV